MNDQNRETKELTLPHSGKKIVFYSFIKAKEMIAVAAVDPKEAQKLLIEKLVVSLDGETDGLYDKIIELSYQDFKALDKELMKLVKTDEEENSEKKTS